MKTEPKRVGECPRVYKYNIIVTDYILLIVSFRGDDDDDDDDGTRPFFARSVVQHNKYTPRWKIAFLFDINSSQHYNIYV